MGAGKTTIGMHLAAKLGIGFLDSDKEIEAQAGASVSEVFKRDGEEFFRKVEAKVISEILQRGASDRAGDWRRGLYECGDARSDWRKFGGGMAECAA